MSERTCNGCVACCKVMSIDEIKKPPSIWCPHCDIGKGCKIYEDRPPSCAKFRCLWLKDARLPESMRPDKTKVVLSVVTGKEPRLQANVDPDRPFAWSEGETGAYIRTVMALGVDVLIVVGKKKYLQAAYKKQDGVQNDADERRRTS